jgi:AcrR family transcriptional regulator
VGAGTVYRHFPTKDALIRAVIDDRVRGVVEHGRALLASDPPQALFEFLRWMTAWGRTDLGLVEALAGAGIDLGEVAPDADSSFRAIVADMVTAGNRAGTVRADVTAADVKALMGACQVADAQAMERIMMVVIDGLRAAR